MRTLNETKKTAVDWHREDIKAALAKKGWSLRQLSLKHGYSNGSTLKNALDRPWLKGERIIAEAISVPAEEIWPERFAHRQNKKFADR
ncbi:helix-turn-helix domain-containing protein [Pasteurella multocida subsp. multocida]|uniref:Helix-turn-helix domain-containing protein n=1 Tax=Pasteurella multocida TaxID=747 RepID=A0A9X3US30_PASMD|nr:helix-turn-helix domain-containing protein [Pasteurella multocida]MBF6981678.1 helix-turn-helix domain-containing protein [Pasteurella multocida]MDA5619369.1 helix-turn-helix domain-containing protein [Pasteurella multocida subsp. multocida]MDA5621900.1 helix-turn-helix domain-containing protein [Pasteurella multocida subsp. multocida]MDA5624312.1 helix-turn-helix domain-containing protein [Pasteurella multocida]ODS43410.1 Nlp family transcriptional regulator [Pasteurella multocida]